jgi:hypothetical protein
MGDPSQRCECSGVCCLLNRTQLEFATFFQHLPSRATSPFRQNMELPCTEMMWTARTAEQWSLTTISRPESLVDTLRRYIATKSSLTSFYFEMFGHRQYAGLVFAYCLCGLSFDVNKRDLMREQ